MPTTRLYPDADISNTMDSGDWSDIDEDFSAVNTTDRTRAVNPNKKHRVSFTNPPTDILFAETVKLLFNTYGLTTQVKTGLTFRLFTGSTELASQTVNVDDGGANTNGSITFVLSPTLTQSEVDDLRVEYETVSAGNAPAPELEEA